MDSVGERSSDASSLTFLEEEVALNLLVIEGGAETALLEILKYKQEMHSTLGNVHGRRGYFFLSQSAGQ